MGEKYPSVTEKALADALAARLAGTASQAQRVLLVLADGAWHDSRELAIKCGHRFGSGLFRLKRRGVLWDKRQQPGHPEEHWQYRLVTKQELDERTGQEVA